MNRVWKHIGMRIVCIGVAAAIAAIPMGILNTKTTVAMESEYIQEDDCVLSCVYVELPEIYQGETQAIAVGFQGLELTSSYLRRIDLVCVKDGTEIIYPYTTVTDDMAVFFFEPENLGSYEVSYVDIYTVEGDRRVAFADYGVQTSYEVKSASDNCDVLITENEMVMAALNSDSLAEEMQELLPVQAQNGQIVVVLDPGHDATHCGAAGNGLREEVLTLKIAQYCKEELEKYKNVTVYMTRNDGSCLDPSSNSKCMEARCRYAANMNADVLVSIHVDAGSTTRTGAMALVAKNGVYRDDLSTVTQDVGQKILDELTSIGLASRGLYIRMSDSTGEEFRYPNGATADWYSIVRNSIKMGIPGLIMEHGFISNPSDVANYLNSDEKLKALGVADATGIAKYFGLSKDASVIDVMINTSEEPYVENKDDISGFVSYLYHSVLDRTASKVEVSNWLTKVAKERLTGSALVKRFLNSVEFQGKNYTNEEYVEKLYEIYLGRTADSSGLEHWTTLLASGTSRMEVADRIGNSPEFEQVCVRYGMAQGSHSMQYVKLYPEIAEFATEYYRGLLGREPDPDGLEHWTKGLITGDKSAADLTRGFIRSPEFVGRNLSADEFVEGLYQTYLGRASDEGGKAHWISKLPSMSWSEQETVIRGFLNSPEYKEHCSVYGVRVGTL